MGKSLFYLPKLIITVTLVVAAQKFIVFTLTPFCIPLQNYKNENL